MGAKPQFPRLWFFVHDGFSEDAQRVMQAEGVMWPARQDLNKLLAHVGLKSLPEV